MGNLDRSDNIPIYEEAARRGFCQRVGVYYMWDFFADHADTFSLLSGRTDPGRQIFSAGLKLIGDGIAFVTQPIFPYAESASYLANLGTDRIKQCYPIKKILEGGVTLGFSTDAPATFWSVPSDPFPGLKLSVTRRAADGTDCGADQAVDAETAMKLYTREAAKAADFSGSGMLKKGYRADFAVLSDNIFEIPPEQIDRLQVMETYINGKCVYRRQED